MKKIITSFMVLFFLIGVGTKSYGQAAGDYVFTQPTATDSLWLHISNWGISDGAGGTSAATRLPGVNDNVYIPANKLNAIVPSFTGSASLTKESATITLTAANPALVVGMNVTGTNVAANSKIVSINGTSVVLSLASTSTITTPTTSTLTFAYATTITSSITSGSTTATLSETNAFVFPGMLITGVGIATGTTVQSVSGMTLTLSTAATATNAIASLTFAQNPSCKSLNVSGAFRNMTSFVVNGDINVGGTGLVTVASNASCKNLNVNGVVRNNAEFVVNGDVTVNLGGILTLATDLYCVNLNNYGTFNSAYGYRSSKNLYVGYLNKVPGTSDYAIINDGTFGDTAPKVPQGNTGGINVIYSNQANSVTIKTSTPSVSTYAFNAAQLVPTAYSKTTANTTLNIKETMSLLKSSGINLSVQNNDSSVNTTRTCNIDPGVTVYLGCNFHANRGVSTNPQGSFVYNVYGTLDLGTYASVNNNMTAAATQITAFSLCMTTVAGNAGSLTFNLGDGTQANAGSLILGSNVQMIKQNTQTIAINFKDYSTVKVTGNYGWVMNYQLLNNNNPALYLFPKNYFNLTLNGAGVILPVVAAIKGTKTYTQTYVPPVDPATTPATSWTKATSATQGSILYTGTSYYYVPVVRATSSYKTGDNPLTLVGDTIFQYIKPSTVLPGIVINGPGISNFTVTSLSGNSLTMSAIVGTMNPNAPVSNAILSFTGGKSDAATAPTGTSTNAYSPVLDGTQYLIYLGGNDFPTTSTTLTAVNSPNAANDVFVYSNERNKLVIANANEGDIAAVYTISGIKVASAKLTSDKTTVSIASGIYLVKVNASVSKVIVR